MWVSCGWTTPGLATMFHICYKAPGISPMPSQCCLQVWHCLTKLVDISGGRTKVAASLAVQLNKNRLTQVTQSAGQFISTYAFVASTAGHGCMADVAHNLQVQGLAKPGWCRRNASWPFSKFNPAAPDQDRQAGRAEKKQLHLGLFVCRVGVSLYWAAPG